ncbi:hypothetical protein Q7P37_000406 [Cladosporium fusiforme]
MFDPLYPANPLPFAERDAEIFVIRGAGMPDPKDWLHASGRWLAELSAGAPDFLKSANFVGRALTGADARILDAAAEVNNPRKGPFTLRSKSSTHEAQRDRPPRASGTEPRTSSTPGIDDVLFPPDQASAGASGEDDSLSIKGETPSLKSFALCGIGGSGKTEVAAEYAFRREKDFDAVFWVAVDNKDILTEEFARTAVSLDLVEPSEPTDLLAACELVKGWLSNPVKTYEENPMASNESRWLLIFDNADRYDVLDDFWPTTGLGSVLVTSRDVHAKDQTYTANVGIEVTPFGVEESSDMMRQLIPSHMFDGQETYVREIAEKLGGLPLLLTQMSGMMTRLRLSCRDFLRLCEERDIEHLDWFGDDTSRSAQVSKISTSLGLDGLSAGSLALLRMSSLLDPDCIPDDVLIKAIDQKASHDFPSTYKEYYNTRLELQQSSLVGCNRATGDLTLHRIVQDVTLASMGQTERLELFHAALQAVSEAWPFIGLQDRFNTDRYPVCARIFPSVVRLKQTQTSMLKEHECKDPDAVASLFSDAGWYWFERGFPQEAKDFWRLTEQLPRAIWPLSNQRKGLLAQTR